MRFIVTILLFFISWLAVAQKDEEEVLGQMKRFHQLIVERSSPVDQYLDDSLTYGHSNGWIERKKEFLSNLGNKITYHSFREDSIDVVVNDKMAHARFIADIEATMNGTPNKFRLKVLEVWVKKRSKWRLFARQAIRG